MYYEVQFPSGSETRTIQIEAPSWRAAFVAGYARTHGDPPTTLDDLFVELKGKVVRVTHPASRMHVRITELDEKNVRQSQIVKAIRDSQTSQPAERPSSVSVARARPVGFKDKNTGAFRSIGSTEIQQNAVESGIRGRVVADTTAPSASKSGVVQVEDPAAEAQAPTANQSISETALEDVFLEIMAIFEPEYAMEDAIDFVLDLARKYIPSAAGGLLFASDSADHLYFAQARGKGRKKALKAQLDIQKGIPARCLKDGASIAVKPSNDPRHTPELGEILGLDVASICCAPIQSGPRAYGVMVLVNREERDFFSQYDANILTYIGSQMGKYIQEQLDAAPLE